MIADMHGLGEEVGPKHYSDIRTINFDILSKKGLKLDFKFYTKYQCKRKKTKGWTGSFWFKLEIDNTNIQYIDYNMKAPDEYDHRYGPYTRYFHAIHKNDKVKEPVSKLEEYSGDIHGNYPHRPTSIQGIIKTKFRMLDLKTKPNPKDAEMKVNLGSPMSPSNPNRIPLETIDTAIGQEQNITKHEEL